MAIEVDKNAVGQRIHKIRQDKGETLEKFGKRFNPPANRSLVSAWENGRYLPNNERVKKIADIGSFTVDELLYGDLFIHLRTISDLYFSNIDSMYFGKTKMKHIEKAINEIKYKNISYSNEQELIRIVADLISKSKQDFIDNINKYVSKILFYLKDKENRNILESDLKNSSYGYFYLHFKNVEEFYQYLSNNKNNYEELLLYDNILESLNTSIEFLFENSYMISDHYTHTVKLKEFISNGYKTENNDRNFMNIISKNAKKNITFNNTTYSETITIFDEELDRMYIIPDYKEDFFPTYSHCPYLVIIDNIIHIEYLSDNMKIVIKDKTYKIEEIDFIAPLISILF